VQLPSGSWRAKVYAGTDPLTGREIRFLKTCKTERAAQINCWSIPFLLPSLGMREWSRAGTAHPEGASGQTSSTAYGAWLTP
jgi:hypothetical protein